METFQQPADWGRNHERIEPLIVQTTNWYAVNNSGPLSFVPGCNNNANDQAD